MVLIFSYALLLIAVSVWMIARPDMGVSASQRYCRWRYMHPTEIVICLLFGAPFVFYADTFNHQALYRTFGYVLLSVGCLLVLTPPTLHRRLGLLVIGKIGKHFRWGGLFSLGFGIILFYFTLSAMISSRF